MRMKERGERMQNIKRKIQKPNYTEEEEAENEGAVKEMQKARKRDRSTQGVSDDEKLR